MEIYKLTEHKYAQCGAYSDVYLAPKMGWCQEIGFISYNTKVIIRRGSRIIFTGYYSRTTSKQMGWYLKAFADVLHGLNADTLKIMDKERCAYNDVTGELEPLTEREEREIKTIRQAAFRWGYMNKKEIMEAIKSLAHSQGYYGRLYETLKENSEALEFLEKQNFKDSLEMVMFLEA